jgi:hypothetical protein
LRDIGEFLGEEPLKTADPLFGAQVVRQMFFDFIECGDNLTALVGHD